ncbi:MAG TPA: hypothetical protein VJJ02_03500 [Candidatus Paceibacterota bacterium]
MNHDTPLVKRAYNLGLKAVPNFVGLSAEQIAYYEQHLDEIPNALARGFVVSAPVEKFALLVDLGVITMPANYVSRTRLDLFKAEYQNEAHKSFYFYHDVITDANFPNPSRILKPGDKLYARAFRQVVSGTTTSEERMVFLKSQDAVLCGAQGVSLVWEQKRNKLPKGKWYCSFDEKDRLPSVDGYYGVPVVRVPSVGDFHFYLGSFERVWRGDDVLLCFRDKPFVD